MNDVMRQDLETSSAQRAFGQLRVALRSRIIGQEALVDRLLIALLADGHLLVEGAPGLAKTTAVKELAARIEGDFHRVQFTPDLLPADLTGTEIYRPENASFVFQRGPLFHNVLLADEVLTEAGVAPEMVARGCYASGEAGESFHKMAVEGMVEQTRDHSPTSQYGTLTRHEQLPAEEVRQRMKDTLRDIRNGRFAEEWAREQADGYPNLKRLRRQAFRHPLNRVEKNIRPLTPR